MPGDFDLERLLEQLWTAVRWLVRNPAALLGEAEVVPHRDRDLVVRVAGYSDFFVRHSPQLQQYIIEREKHAVEV